MALILKGSNGRQRTWFLSWKHFGLTISIIFCFLEAPRIGDWMLLQQQQQTNSMVQAEDSYSDGLRDHRQEMLDLDEELLFDSDEKVEKENFAAQLQSPGVEDFFENNDPTSLSTWMKMRNRVYDDRKKRVEQICRQMNVTSSSIKNSFDDAYSKVVDKDSGRFVERIKRDQFLLARSSQLLGCFINKVASSSFVKTFLALEGMRVEKVTSPHAYRPRLVPESDKEYEFSTNHFYKFMFVRHPMERLVSCYYDKMMVNPHKSLRAFRRAVKIRARKIMARSRSQSISETESIETSRKKRSVTPSKSEDLNDKSIDDNSVKFQQTERQTIGPSFETPIIQLESRVGGNSSDLDLGRKLNANESAALAQDIYDGKVVIPTFEEFLVYILSTDLQGEGFSSHWVPYWRQCTPCSFQYHMIGKLETGYDDFTYLWKLTGMDLKAPIPREHIGITSEIKKAAEHKEKMKSYYSKVPRQLLLRVYEAFKLDFLLFDYDFNEVLTLAGYEPIK